MSKKIIEVKGISQRPKRKVIEVKRVSLDMTDDDLSRALLEVNAFPTANILQEEENGLGPQNATIQTKLDPSSNPSTEQLAAIKAKQIKTGIVDYWNDFKIKEEDIHLESGGSVATIAAGNGNTFVMFFDLLSFEPPSVSCQSLKKVSIPQSNPL